MRRILFGMLRPGGRAALGVQKSSCTSSLHENGLHCAARFTHTRWFAARTARKWIALRLRVLHTHTMLPNRDDGLAMPAVVLPVPREREPAFLRAFLVASYALPKMQPTRRRCSRL